MVPYVIPLADKALLVRLAHVRKELVVGEEALATELAQRMYATLDILDLAGGSFTGPLVGEHRRQMQREDVGWVERVFVREHFLVSDA